MATGENLQTQIDEYSKRFSYLLRMIKCVGSPQNLKFEIEGDVRAMSQYLSRASTDELASTSTLSFSTLTEALGIFSEEFNIPEIRNAKIVLAKAVTIHCRAGIHIDSKTFYCVKQFICSFSNWSEFENEDRHILYEATEVSAEVLTNLCVGNRNYFVDLPQVLISLSNWTDSLQPHSKIIAASEQIAYAIKELYRDIIYYKVKDRKRRYSWIVSAVKGLSIWYLYDRNKKIYKAAARATTHYLRHKNIADNELSSLDLNEVVQLLKHFTVWYDDGNEAIRQINLNILYAITKKFESEKFIPEDRYLRIVPECIYKMLKDKDVNTIRNSFLTIINSFKFATYQKLSPTVLVRLAKILTKYCQTFDSEDNITAILDIANVLIIETGKFMMAREFYFAGLSSLLQSLCYWRSKDNESKVIQKAANLIANIFVLKYKDDGESSSESASNADELAHAIDVGGYVSRGHDSSKVVSVSEQNIERLQTNIGNISSAASGDNIGEENGIKNKEKSSESSGSDSKLCQNFNAYSDRSSTSENLKPKKLSTFACRLSTWTGCGFDDSLFEAMNVIARIILNNSVNNGTDLTSYDEQSLNCLMYAFTKWKQDDKYIKRTVVAISKTLEDLHESGKLKQFSIKILIRLAKYFSQWQQYHKDTFSSIVTRILVTIEGVNNANFPLNWNPSDLAQYASTIRLFSVTEDPRTLSTASDIIADIFYADMTNHKIGLYMPRYLRKLVIAFCIFYESKVFNSALKVIQSLADNIREEFCQTELNLKDLAVLSDVFTNWPEQFHSVGRLIAKVSKSRYGQGCRPLDLKSLSLLIKSFSSWSVSDREGTFQDATRILANSISDVLETNYSPYKAEELVSLTASFSIWLQKESTAQAAVRRAMDAIALNINLQFKDKRLREFTLEQLGKLSVALYDFNDATEFIVELSIEIYYNMDNLGRLSKEAFSDLIKAFVKCYNGNQSIDVLIHATGKLFSKAFEEPDTIIYVTRTMLPYEEELWNMVNYHRNDIDARKLVSMYAISGVFQAIKSVSFVTLEQEVN
ncbi:hypothetical protein C0J52_12193 [Blattella germanica]|nr:hypothetical protein C0J52_12193 [Blattella germanica]